jgi:hypothetical protein
LKTIVVVILFVLSQSVLAASKDLGLGVMIGNPTGFAGKKWLGQGRAVDGGLAWSFGKHSNVSMHGDYLLHTESAFYFNDVHPLDLYYGIGGRMEFADDIELGVRVPVGLVHQFTEQSADIFGEIAPILDFVSRTGVELHFVIGSRYYF